MKAVFIPYNQAYKERLIEILDKMSIRGFTLWEQVQGRGSDQGEPHYGSHAWPTMNSAILTVIPDEKVEELLRKLREIDALTEKQGLHAFVWNVENAV
ncbi:MAG: hypothetical protein LBH32_14630 [Dysgonamonadaceae bacterium]|jgi:nitrogen regulatory protein PII|nr:hypothetical protein [Dysgonamonadaceae bacterium]